MLAHALLAPNKAWPQHKLRFVKSMIDSESCWGKSRVAHSLVMWNGRREEPEEASQGILLRGRGQGVRG